MENTGNQSCSTELLILRAAEKEFLEKGFSGAKTTTIAEAAGVTHAMLHYYYRTKEKLFDTIVTDKIEQLGDILIGSIGNPELPLKERVREGIERHFDYLAAHPLLPRFIVNELAERPGRIHPIREQLLKKAGNFVENVRRELQATGAADIDPVMILSDVISLNVFPFLAAPMIEQLAAGFYGGYREYLDRRKQENVRTILKKLNLE